MKKLTIFAILLAVTMMVCWSTVAVAGSAFTNARADFQPFTDNPSPPVPANGSGHAILNYVKGMGQWEIQLVVRNLLPDTDYKLQAGQQDTPVGAVDLFDFKTDGKGKANVHYTYVPSAPPASDAQYSIVRIIDLEYSPQQNPGVGGTIVMMAREDGKVGLLQFRGGRRGQ